MSKTPSLPASFVAAFDFDGTLTYGDSFFPFLKSAVGPFRFYWGLIILSPILVGYALRLLPNWCVKQAVLTHFLGGWTGEKLQQVAEKFAVQHLPRLLRPEAVQRLRWHQQQGHQLVLVSASLEAYLRPWAESIQCHLIGTRLEVQSGKLTGRIYGKNCYGPEKVKRLEAALGNLAQYHLYAYGDSKGDRELLAAAQSPYFRSFQSTTPDSSKPPTQWQRGLVVSVLTVVFLYTVIVLWSGSAQFVEALQQLPNWLIPVSIVIAFSSFCLRFLRWHWYLLDMGYRVPLVGSFRIFFAGFALCASPGRAGESIRSLLLKRRYKTPIAPTLAALLCERFTDLLSVFLLISFGIFSLVQEKWIVLLIVGIQVGIIWFLQRPTLLKQIFLTPLSRWSKLKFIMHRIEALIDSTSALLRPKILFGSVLLGSLSWALEGIALYLIFQCLGASSINAYQAVMILAASDLVGAISMLPEGIGGSEATLISLSLLYGVARSPAVTATFLIRFLTLWFGVCLGICAFLWEQHRKSGSKTITSFISEKGS